MLDRKAAAKTVQTEYKRAGSYAEVQPVFANLAAKVQKKVNSEKGKVKNLLSHPSFFHFFTFLPPYFLTFYIPLHPS